jgi:starch-binding outer membrane protein, SusD/RagB family
MLPGDIKVPAAGEINTDEKIDAFDAQYGTRTIDMIKAAGDDRAMFYSGIGGGIRKIETDVISGFKDGLSIVKWQNIRSDGQPTHHTEYPDTDIPLMRLSEAYLTRAEAKFRLGEDATEDINTLR